MRTRPRNLDNNEVESYHFKVDECVKQQILVLNCTKMTDWDWQIGLRFWYKSHEFTMVDNLQNYFPQFNFCPVFFYFMQILPKFLCVFATIFKSSRPNFIIDCHPNNVSTRRIFNLNVWWECFQILIQKVVGNI